MIGKDGRNYPDRRAAASPSWKGGRQPSGNGAIQAVAHDHPRAASRGRVYEHILVAERVLGKVLPLKAVVHHVDGKRTHNEPGNLVVCQDQGYHLFLHHRQRAFRASGHADWFHCTHCKRWDAPENLTVERNRGASGIRAYHKACAAEYQRKRKAKRAA